jgi:PAS domain S-box-containing protein
MAEKVNSGFKKTNGPVVGFLSGGGEMGNLIQEFKWSDTPLGPISLWPQSLRTALSIIVRSKFPMVLVWGDKYTFFYNDAYRPTLGNDGKHPKSLGSPASEIWKEAWKEVEPLIDLVYKEGQTLMLEDLLIPIYRNGKHEEVYWTFSYSPLTDESDSTAGVFITCLETTEKILRQESFRENLKSLELAMQIGELGIFKIDLVNDQAEYSEQIMEFLGLEKQNVPLREIFNRIHPDDEPKVKGIIDKSIAGENEGKHDIIYKVIDPKNQQLKYLHSIGQVVFSNGKAISIAGTIQDVSKQILAKKRLEESEARFRSLADQSPMFVFLVDGQTYGKMNYFNKTFLDYTGRTLEEAIEKAWDGIVHPDDRKVVESIYLPAFENQLSYTIPALRIRRHDGAYRWHMFKGNPRHLSNGEFIGFVGVGIDIHEQKLALDQLELNNAQLKRINNDLDNFIYTASHDLKAPMSNIEGLLNAMRNSFSTDKDTLNEETETLLQMMEQSIHRFKVTIQDLTEISKVQREEVEDVNEIDLAEIIEDVKHTLCDKIEESKAVIELDLSAVNKINFSRKNIKSIIYNLLSNAIKYRDKSRTPKILLKTEKTDTYNVLMVNDNGLGIQKQNLDKIFSMFKRFHSHVEGTGIGLYIVKRIIDNAGGKIEVESEVKKGTTFKVYFRKRVGE